MLCYSLACYIVLYYIILYDIILYYIILHCNITSARCREDRVAALLPYMDGLGRTSYDFFQSKGEAPQLLRSNTKVSMLNVCYICV